MKKNLLFTCACGALLTALYSCGGSAENAVVEPTPDPVAWTDTVTFTDMSGAVTAMDVKAYNAAGQVALVEQYSPSKGEDAKMLLTDKIIYQNGKPAYGKTFEADKVVGTDIYTYDAAGNLQKEVIASWNTEKQKLEDETMYEYTYNEKGDVTMIKESKFENLRWVDVYEWTYIYDEQGRIAERKDYTCEGERKQSCWYTWVYNEKSQCTQMDFYFFDIKGGKLKHDAKTQYKYNDAGQVLTATVIRHKNNQKRDDINSRLFTYEYNQAGQLTLMMNQRWTNATKTWYEVANSTYAYDALGRLFETKNITHTNKGVKMVTETTVFGTPADKVVASPAAPAASIKPEVNVYQKHETSAPDEE